LNPRTPTRQGPKPCSFDQTGRPPPSSSLRLENTLSAFNILLTVSKFFSLFGSCELNGARALSQLKNLGVSRSKVKRENRKLFIS
jgi:hypothetical protein